MCPPCDCMKMKSHCFVLPRKRYGVKVLDGTEFLTGLGRGIRMPASGVELSSYLFSLSFIRMLVGVLTEWRCCISSIAPNCCGNALAGLVESDGVIKNQEHQQEAMRLFSYCIRLQQLL